MAIASSWSVRQRTQDENASAKADGLTAVRARRGGGLARSSIISSAGATEISASLRFMSARRPGANASAWEALLPPVVETKTEPCQYDRQSHEPEYPLCVRKCGSELGGNGRHLRVAAGHVKMCDRRYRMAS